MKTSRVLTLKQLEKAGACEEQKDLFKRLFGESVEITLETVEKYGKRFRIDWAAHMLLSYGAWLLYCSRTAWHRNGLEIPAHRAKCALVFSELYIRDGATLFEKIKHTITKFWKQFNS